MSDTTKVRRIPAYRKDPHLIKAGIYVFAANLLIDDAEMFDYLEEGYNVVATAGGLGVNVNLLMLKLIEMNKQQGFNFQVSDTPERCFMGNIEDSNTQDW